MAARVWKFFVFAQPEGFCYSVYYETGRASFYPAEYLQEGISGVVEEI